MNKLTKYTLGVLTVIATAILISVSFSNQFKIDITKDKSTFYSNISGKFVVSGVEYVLINASGIKSTSIKQAVNGSLVDVVRESNYKSVKVIDTYLFDGNAKFEDFPVNHKINVVNGSDLVLNYHVTNLDYTGFEIVSLNKVKFGKNMVIEFDSGYDKITPDSKKKTFDLYYPVDSNDKSFNVRLFDPDGEFPQFFNLTNASLTTTCSSYASFWADIANCNVTAWLQVNNTNYTAVRQYSNSTLAFNQKGGSNGTLQGNVLINSTFAKVGNGGAYTVGNSTNANIITTNITFDGKTTGLNLNTMNATICVWVNVLGNVTGQTSSTISTYLTTSNTTKPNIEFRALRNNTNTGVGRLNIILNNDTTGANPLLEDNTNYSYNVWKHVCLVIDRNSSQAILYINGSAVMNGSLPSGQIANSSGVRNLSMLKMPVAVNVLTNPFNGSVDEVMIFNDSLNSTAIANLYANQSIGLRANTLDSRLFAYFTFDTGFYAIATTALVNNTYTAFWGATGNGSAANQNTSNQFSYIVLNNTNTTVGVNDTSLADVASLNPVNHFITLVNASRVAYGNITISFTGNTLGTVNVTINGQVIGTITNADTSPKFFSNIGANLSTKTNITFTPIIATTITITETNISYDWNIPCSSVTGCNTTAVIQSIWAYNSGKFPDQMSTEPICSVTPINTTFASAAWGYSGVEGRFIDGVGGGQVQAFADTTIGVCNMTDLAIAFWCSSGTTRTINGIGSSSNVPANATYGKYVWEWIKGRTYSGNALYLTITKEAIIL